MNNFATIDDVIALFRDLTEAETTKAEALLEVVSNRLRFEAEKVGKDLDVMRLESDTFATVLKSVTVDVVARSLLSDTSEQPMTQFTESALGYSFTGTPLNAGGGIFIKNAELSALGLRRQQIGGLELC